jgi:hypothetical protein
LGISNARIVILFISLRYGTEFQLDEASAARSGVTAMALAQIEKYRFAGIYDLLLSK